MYVYMYVYVYVYVDVYVDVAVDMDMGMDIWYTHLYIYMYTFTYGTHGRLKLYFGLVQRRKNLVTIDPFHYSYVLPENNSIGALCIFVTCAQVFPLPLAGLLHSELLTGKIVSCILVVKRKEHKTETTVN